MQNVCRWYGDQAGNQPGSARRRSFLTSQPAPADPARGRGGPAGHTGVADRWALRVGRNKGSTYTLVFNRRTYQLPSMNWTGRLGLNGASRGEVLVKLAIVNGQASYPDPAALVVSGRDLRKISLRLVALLWLAGWHRWDRPAGPAESRGRCRIRQPYDIVREITTRGVRPYTSPAQPGAMSTKRL